MGNEPKISRKKIKDLQQDPSNANAGTERGLRMLDDSLAEIGLGRSVVTDKNGYLIAGNKTTERAVDRGFEDAIIVHTTGKQLVVVQRDDLDLLIDDPNNPARKLAYADNRTSEIGLAWDASRIAADIEAAAIKEASLQATRQLAERSDMIREISMVQSEYALRHAEITELQPRLDQLKNELVSTQTKMDALKQAGTDNYQLIKEHYVVQDTRHPFTQRA